LGRVLFIGRMGGLPVLKMSLKARSREEVVAEPFCEGTGYGRVRGSAITGYSSINGSVNMLDQDNEAEEGGWVLVLPLTSY
jgi:hypothetical protein